MSYFDNRVCDFLVWEVVLMNAHLIFEARICFQNRSLKNLIIMKFSDLAGWQTIK